MKPWPMIRAVGSRLIRHEEGAAAIEFGLVAPILTLGVLVATDLGRAEYERMTIDHTLRSAAQYAMADPGEAAVCQRVLSLAQKHFDVGTACTGGETAPLKVKVSRYCACPTAPETPVLCSADCNADHTYVYYNLTGRKTQSFNSVSFYTHWRVSRELDLTSSVQVQTR